MFVCGLQIVSFRPLPAHRTFSWLASSNETHVFGDTGGQRFACQAALPAGNKASDGHADERMEIGYSRVLRRPTHGTSTSTSNRCGTSSSGVLAVFAVPSLPWRSVFASLLMVSSCVKPQRSIYARRMWGMSCRLVVLCDLHSLIPRNNVWQRLSFGQRGFSLPQEAFAFREQTAT